MRILGKGQARGARDLTREEAREAMSMLLDGKVEEAQLGAFLMLLRHREESARASAGFTEAARERVPQAPKTAGRPGQLAKLRRQDATCPGTCSPARCLAANGVRIVTAHGGGAHTAATSCRTAAAAARYPPLRRRWAEVGAALDEHRLAFIPTGCLDAVLQRMIDMRNPPGLRSPIHLLARLLNPLGARCGRLQSIFHPGYQDTHRQASTCSATTPSSSRAKAARSR
ncbi:hypothetical protein M4D79_13715 [Mycolicibacterium novocastrense]|nr:hypothetical protein M4D79_13715 [Mycolicibacterium novocastrense]